MAAKVRRTAAERALEEALKKYEATETSKQIELLATRMAEMAKRIEELDEKVTEIRDYANKWRGGFYAIAGLGAGIGTIAAFWDRVRPIWAH